MTPRLVVASFAVACAALGCQARRPATAARDEAVADPAEAAPIDDCGAPIAGADDLLRPGSNVFLGEIHGTRQVPLFLGDLICLGVRKGLAVSVVLEWNVDEDARRYLHSTGSLEDRRALTAGPQWDPAIADGRSSEALVAFLERMRRLMARRAPISLVGFDGHGGPAETASVLAARRTRAPDDLLLLVAGNAHTCADPRCAPYRNEATALVDDHAWRVTSLVLSSAGGTFFGIRGTRGVHRLSAPPAPTPPRSIRLHPERRKGVDGTFSVGPLTASLPARAPGPDPARDASPR